MYFFFTTYFLRYYTSLQKNEGCTKKVKIKKYFRQSTVSWSVKTYTCFLRKIM